MQAPFAMGFWHGVGQAIQSAQNCWGGSGAHQALVPDGGAGTAADGIPELNAAPPSPNGGCLSSALDKLLGNLPACNLPSGALPTLSPRMWGALMGGVVGCGMAQVVLFGSPLSHPDPQTVAEYTALGALLGAGVGFGMGWVWTLGQPSASAPGM